MIRYRVERSALAAALLAAILTACTPPDETGDPAMDYAEARSELEQLFDRIQDRIGGEWQRMDGGAFPCGADGAQALLSRIGPGVPEEQQPGIVESVVAELTEAGFAPTIAELPPLNGAVVTEISYPGRDEATVDRVQITVGIGSNASDVSGQSRCVPGDPDDLNTAD